jgi:uncharacterized protein (TIGR03437 family)
MTHASLCKKTYEAGTGLQAAVLSFVLLFLFTAGTLFGQISPGSLPGGTVGVAYSVQIEDTGAPENFDVAWGIVAGNLPPGLSLNTASMTGTTSITGTPTTAGVYSFEVEDEYNTSAQTVNMKDYTISVSAGCSPTLSPASPLPQADVNVRYTAVQFSVVGCPGSYTFSVQAVDPFNPNTLPPGIQLSPGGLLSGTPTSTGTYTFAVTLTDQNMNESEFQYSLTVNALPSLTTTSPLPNGPVGVPYSQQIAATGGVPPYIFSMDNNPPGITITTGGLLNGTPTTVGTYNFNIGVTDSVHGQVTSPFQVTFAAAISQLQVTPQSLTFQADVNGNTPPPQAISVVPASTATPPVNYHVTIDNGQAGGAAPAWISVFPTSGVAPASLTVTVNQGSLGAGSYPARIQVIDSNGLATAVSVSLQVTNQSPLLSVAPGSLNFAGQAASGSLTQQLVVSNSGAGTLNFTTSVANGSPWISSVTASASGTTANAPVFVQVQVNTTGLAPGAYRDAIVISSQAGNVQVPVSLFVTASGPVLGLDTTGVLFQAIEGGGSTATETVKVLDLGTPGSTVSWNASVVGGSNWLSVSPASGLASSGVEGALTLALSSNATTLMPGPYYAVVQVADSNSLNSPQYVTAVFNLQPSTATPVPTLSPDGLFFTAVAGATGGLPSQQVQINTSSASAVAFNATATTADTGTWLAVTPSSGSASGQSAGSVAVSANPSGLVAGIYTGNVNISIGALLQSVNVTLVVQPVTSSNAIAEARPHASACQATKLAITETGLPNDFSVPAGWPATLIVQLNDDCATPVTNGNVIANFSNGDAPLNLVGDTLGNYSATWQPGAVNASMVVTLNATASSLQPATAELYGGIGPNQTPPPTLVSNATVNNLNPVPGAALSPGTIAQVYGTGLGTSPVSTGAAPLPTTFDNTFALVGPSEAPLYFLSSGQVNIQIPYEASANQQMPIVLSVNNAITLPQMLSVVPATPGVLSDDKGRSPSAPQNGANIVAQHSADYSMVTSANPAKPGEYLLMYLVGMGATNPPVASGVESPTSPLAYVVAQPTVTVNSQPATVSFAGLTPGFVGLYQVDFQVPMGLSSGEFEVDVTQNGVAANPTMLPVN